MATFSRDNRPLNLKGRSLSKVIKGDADALMEWLKQIPNREGAIARLKLEECVMWATKGIANLSGNGENES